MSQVTSVPLKQPMPATLARLWPGLRRYGPILLACGLPLILGLAIVALLGPEGRSSLLRYEEKLGVLGFWMGFLAGLPASAAAGLSWLLRRQTERAREQEREAAAGARQRLLRNLDHELKTPVTTMRLTVERLQLVPDFPPEQRASLQSIGHQVNRLQSLIEALRRLTEQDESRLEKTRVDVAEILQEAVEIARTTPAYQGRTISLDVRQVPWPLPPVWGDHDCLLVVFRNLIENALKFGGEQGRVEVRAWQEARNAAVEIADTGVGIPPEDLPYVFEELYRGTNARNMPGSGLGLASAQRLVSLHGGTIRAASRLGQGTVMTVRLPVR